MRTSSPGHTEVGTRLTLTEGAVLALLAIEGERSGYDLLKQMRKSIGHVWTPAKTQLAPLLCGGLIGHRALRLAGDGQRLGLYGFGSAAHIICQVAVHEGRRVFAFTRAGDEGAQALARSLGAEWAGDAMQPGPEPLDAALIFAPVGALVPAALRATAPGGTVVCAGIHMSDIPSFPYADLWEERVLRSVANLTRADAEEFLALAPQVPVRTTVTPFSVDEAEDALSRLRAGAIEGAAVVLPG